MRERKSEVLGGPDQRHLIACTTPIDWGDNVCVLDMIQSQVSEN